MGVYFFYIKPKARRLLQDVVETVVRARGESFEMSLHRERVHGLDGPSNVAAPLD